MAYEKVPNQTGQNFPVSTQYATHPGTAVGVPASPQYDTFPTGSVVTPVTILGASVLQWCRADTGTNASWTDLSGNGKHYIQAVGTAQPTFDATGGPNGTPFFNFDGSNDFMEAALALPDPGTTPSLCYLILRQDTWSGGDVVFGDSAGFRLTLYQSLTTPRLRPTATVDGAENAAATLGTWVRAICYFSDTTSDYLTIKGTNATGTSVASAAGTARQIGGQAGARFCDVSIAEIIWVNRNITADEKTQLDDYTTARYGSGLTS